MPKSIIGEDDDARYMTDEPKPERWVNSHEARAKRAVLAKQRITIRLDEDTVEGFKELAGEQGYQSLINRALREWLEARSIRELVRHELKLTLREAIHSQNPSAREPLASQDLPAREAS